MPLPLHSSAVGAKFSANEVEITTRRLLAYAAGLGATAESLFDDARPGGIVALPQFCVALEWWVRPGASDPLGASSQERLRVVHASQDSHFHRLIRPGDRLISDGQIVEVRTTRAGAFYRSKFETRDLVTGEPVVTSWSGAIARGVAVEGEAAALESPPHLPEGPLAGDAETIEIPIAREAPHVYTECADIWSPIHTEREVALAAGLPDIILHGTATWALAGCEVIRRRAAGDPTRLARLHGRFTGMVLPGTSITLALDRPRNGTVRFEVRNAAGELAIRGGVAELR